MFFLSTAHKTQRQGNSLNARLVRLCGLPPVDLNGYVEQFRKQGFQRTPHHKLANRNNARLASWRKDLGRHTSGHIFLKRYIFLKKMKYHASIASAWFLAYLVGEANGRTALLRGRELSFESLVKHSY
jgi:hypothetical protein